MEQERAGAGMKDRWGNEESGRRLRGQIACGLRAQTARGLRGQTGPSCENRTLADCENRTPAYCKERLPAGCSSPVGRKASVKAVGFRGAAERREGKTEPWNAEYIDGNAEYIGGNAVDIGGRGAKRKISDKAQDTRQSAGYSERDKGHRAPRVRV